MASRKYRRVFSLGLLAMVLVLALSACTKPETQAPPVSGGDPVTGEPKQGGTLIVAFGVPVTSLDPGYAVGTQGQVVRKTIMESLVYRDEEGNYLPQLAERWETDPDGLTWRFYLRKGVKFHDGTDFTAEAVRRSIMRMIDPEKGLPRGADIKFIDSVDVVDDHTVEIKTKQPVGPFLAYVAMDTMSILSPASLDQWNNDIGWHPVGTGPFKFESYVPEESITVVRNEDYWGEPAYLDSIIFKTVPEDATRLTMLEAGEADIVVNLPAYQISRFEGSPNVEVRVDQCTRVAHIGFNCLSEPFDDVRVRQAMNYAVDKEALVTGILTGLGEPAHSVFAPATWGYSAVGKYPHDPEKAKALLADAGYPNGFKAKLQTPQGRYFMDRETAVAFQAQMAEVGIDLEIETVDWATYLQILRYPPETNETQVYLLGWESGTADFQLPAENIFHSSSWAPKQWNTMFYKNEKTDDLIERAGAEVDSEQRMKLAEELQKTIMEDAPWVPLYVYPQITAVRKSVHGLKVMPTELLFFDQVWKE